MKKYILLIIAVCIGIFARTYQYTERFTYTHDNDLSAWIVKDIVIDKHLRLIGQLTSAPGIFIGPLFYYALIPFYVINSMNPLSTGIFAIGIGALAIFSIWFVFKQMFGNTSANIAALIHAVGFNTALTEREIVPTTPVVLWTVWYLYCLQLLSSGNKRSLLVLAILIGLIWNLNLALALLLPLSFGYLFLNRNKFSIKDYILPAIVLFTMSLPLILFEARHGFSQTKALTQSLFSTKSESFDKVKRLDRMRYLIEKNLTLVFWPEAKDEYIHVFPVSLFVSFVVLLLSKKVSIEKAIIMSLWVMLYVLFFTFHPLNPSEYYLHGINIIWLIISALILANIAKTKLGRIIVFGILLFFAFINIKALYQAKGNEIGYLYRSKLVNFIKTDSIAHDYPCVSVSYITNPGYDLGYRYLFWLENLHVNQPKSGSPVYTIVFPHSLVKHLDKTFGSLGLIFPDYSRYNKIDIDKSCSGENANLTDPMFGFTK